MRMTPGTQIGPFKAKEMLSNSGMSEIWLATEVDRPGPEMVLKINHEAEGKGNKYQDLLRMEAKLLTNLRHPGIVHIYPIPGGKPGDYFLRAVNVKGKPWFYSMEYIAGGSLEKYKSEISKKFPLSWTIELIYQVLTILHYMHEAGYGHCDLKPDNIMFRERPQPNKRPFPVLVDFGSSRPVGEPVQVPTASPFYSPPEVVTAMAQKQVDPITFNILPERVDVWQVGAVYYELLTGQRWVSAAKGEMSTTILRTNMKKIQEVRGDADNALDKLLEVMVHKEAEKRPSVNAIIEAIETRVASVRPPRISI